MTGLNSNTYPFNYWDNIQFTPTYSEQNKYIVFDQYEGGFNNVRMCYEVASVLAYALNRKLVIPPPRNIYLLNSGDLHFSSFFDTSNIIVSTVDYEEFIQTYKLEDAHIIRNEAHKTMYRLDDSAVPSHFTGDTIALNELHDVPVLYFPKNLFGNFYNVIQTNRLSELCKYVAKHLHYKEELFSTAKHFVDVLGDLNYYAIHVRRGDFNSGWLAKEVVLPVETILENIKDAIPEGSKLYIATDEVDKTFFDPFRKKYDIYFYENIQPVEVSKDFIGIVEQIICARAITFVGSFASTFSSYITRLRGYMTDVTDKRHITFSLPYNPNKVDTEQYQGIFVREYSTGWKF